jgi:uncharacterized protein YaiL (DUF2058 family)
MSDLRKALIDAGLLSKQESRRQEHEERVKGKTLGREGREAEQRKQDAERDQRSQDRKTGVQEAQQRRNEDARSDTDWKILQKRIESEAITSGLNGPRRFHYREPDGHLPYLGVDDQVGRRLEAGELCIVRAPGSGRRVAVVPRALADALRAQRPDWLLFHAADH